MSKVSDPKLAEALELWNSFKKPEYLEKDTKAVLETRSEDELKHLFLKRLSFGTAGLRGAMGVGFNAMNVITIMQTSQGLCEYLINKFTLNICKNRGIIFGFDGRHHSESFVHVAAAVFLSKGFRVYVFSQTVATPILCYSNLKKKCVCGVMVTASHNPKLDNGYKVYASNGAQITPPADKDIESCILNNLKPWEEPFTYLDEQCHLKDTSLVEDIYYEMYDSFMHDIEQEFKFDTFVNSRTKLSIIYSPMHGIGRKFVQGIMHVVGFNNLLTVPEQALPDAEFTTVPFPNPEEKEALNLAMQLADKVNSPIVVANDPDADRFACAEKFNGKWRTFTGDELGIIFAYYLIEKYNKLNVDKSKHVFICTAVCSKMLKTLCEKKGYHYCETLTGFKWLMNKAIDMEKLGYVVVYCYEEALGHALTRYVKDKCGISALAFWTEIAINLYKRGSSLHEYLETIRKDIGYFVSNNGYYIVADPNEIRQMFDDFRNGGKYQETLGKYKIVAISDITKGYDSSTADNKTVMPLTADSEMIALKFDNSATITVRSSGTEPKVKWYAEVAKESYEAAKALIDEVVDEVMEIFIQPNKYNAKKM